MSGRIILFGATGYTGKLIAEALGRPRRPAGARRAVAAKLTALSDELGGSRPPSPTSATPGRSASWSAGRRDRFDGRAVRPAGATPPRTPRSPPARGTSTRPASPRSSAACSSASGRGRALRRRHDHRRGLRLGAGQPRGRARAALGRGRGPASRWATSSRAGGRMSGGTRRPRRARCSRPGSCGATGSAPNAARRACASSGRRADQAGDLGRGVRALHDPPDSPRPAGGQHVSRMVCPPAADAGVRRREHGHREDSRRQGGNE